jgi:hypothetical protein
VLAVIVQQMAVAASGAPVDRTSSWYCPEIDSAEGSTGYHRSTLQHYFDLGAFILINPAADYSWAVTALTSV